jgi:hypothetical protein
MGMFRDMKDAFGVLRSDELKELKRKADAQPRANMMEGIRAANEAMDYSQDLQSQYAGMGIGMDPTGTAATYSGGIQGTATINSVADTGVFMNGAPVLELAMTVSVPGRAPYDVTHKQLVSHAALARFQPGSVLPVHVSMQDQNQLTIG